MENLNPEHPHKFQGLPEDDGQTTGGAEMQHGRVSDTVQDNVAAQELVVRESRRRASNSFAASLQMFRKKTVPAPVIIATNESRMSTISELPGTKSAPQHCLIAHIRYWTAALCAALHLRYILVIHTLCVVSSNSHCAQTRWKCRSIRASPRASPNCAPHSATRPPRPLSARCWTPSPVACVTLGFSCFLRCLIEFVLV